MKQAKCIFLSAMLLISAAAIAQHTFRFKNGKFRIVQFTDLHWADRSEKNVRNRESIEYIIKTEKPDLAMLTGDIVTAQPAREGWQSIIKIFENAKLPFVVLMGNHDPEVMNKEDIYKILKTSSYHVGERGPKNISGYGNGVIPVYASLGNTKETKALLYYFDSHDYTRIKEYGYYGWIQNDQVQWYRHLSKQYTKKNDGKPLPALAFFHIPLVEYYDVVKTGKFHGTFEEGEICSPKINTGMFGAFLESKDVMGMFCGHDHNNDFVGMQYGLALAYGRVSGLDTYGHKERGARIIDLFEGERKFETWIRTINKREDSFIYQPDTLTPLTK